MKIKCALTICLSILAGNTMAEIVLDEKKLKAISFELFNAAKNRDASVLDKYMYPGSKIVIDVDPARNRGEREIGYDEYMELTKMSLEMMSEADIRDEIISISVDREKNQGTIEEKTTAIMTMMGMKMKDVSVSKTTYGIVGGEIRVLSSEDQLIS